MNSANEIIVIKRPDLRWNSASVQTGVIRSSMVTKLHIQGNEFILDQRILI